MVMLVRAVKVFRVVAAVLMLYAAALIVPLNLFWFAPGDFIIADAHEGDAPVIIFDREIKRTTVISWAVVVRQVGRRGAVCDARGGPFAYRPYGRLPAGPDLNLDWWVSGDPDCLDLEPGAYSIETCWTGYGLFLGLVPPKTVCTDLHVFKITARDLFEGK